MVGCRDLASATELNDTIGKVFREEQIFRIDHYLGKETVQNLMALRFANALYEPLWNSAHIDHVQITVSEAVGLENRAGYYDKAGALRDMVQNHILQLVCFVAMEAPTSMDAEAVRDEKLKVLRALKPIDEQNYGHLTVRGAGGTHAVIHPDIPIIDNISYLVGDAGHAARLMHPGDALFVPDEPVEVLAAPAAAPWMKIAEAVDFLRAVAPQHAVPIHQGVVAEQAKGIYYGRLDEMTDTDFRVLTPEQEMRF